MPGPSCHSCSTRLPCQNPFHPAFMRKITNMQRKLPMLLQAILRPGWTARTRPVPAQYPMHEHAIHVGFHVPEHPTECLSVAPQAGANVYGKPHPGDSGPLDAQHGALQRSKLPVTRQRQSTTSHAKWRRFCRTVSADLHKTHVKLSSNEIPHQLLYGQTHDSREEADCSKLCTIIRRQQLLSLGRMAQAMSCEHVSFMEGLLSHECPTVAGRGVDPGKFGLQKFTNLPWTCVVTGKASNTFGTGHQKYGGKKMFTHNF